MKKQLHIFFTALMFYTRIPCPKYIDHNPDYLNKASRYFPLIGWIVGGICFGTYYLASILFSVEIALILSIIAGILTTGAFGAIGLVLLFLLKFQSLIQLISNIQYSEFTIYNLQFTIFLLFVSAHSVSRLAAVSIVFTNQYSREDASS